MWAAEDVRQFRASVRRFVRDELAPREPQWRVQHHPDPDDWRRAGEAGLLLPDVPEEYGGGGGTFAHHAIVIDELARAGIHLGTGIQSIVAHYVLAYGSEEQRQRWLPRLASGELIAAIAMTEPAAGSDVQAIATTARREGDHYVLNGAKTFISNAWHAGLVCIAVRTRPDAVPMRALSMLVFETAGLAGYRVGPPLDKVGMHAQDTCEIFLDDVVVPASSLLGPVDGRGFAQMMEQLPYERLGIAVAAQAVSEEAVAITARYVKERVAFGKPLFDLQNTRMVLAECAAQARVGRAFLDDCLARKLSGTLDDASTAIAKYWLTEAQGRIVDACVQLHGGYGYMTEYPIARMWADSRVQRIYAGSNEVMKELIAWAL